MTPTTTAMSSMTATEFYDYCQLPENRNRFLELYRGEVVEMSRPTRKHGIVAGNVGRLIGNWAFQVNRGYVATNDSGVILVEEPATVVGPDVAYYLDAKSFDEAHPKWGEEPPLLAVEVRSPGDRRQAVARKIADYLINGVAEVWYIDYEERYVTIYRQGSVPVPVGEGEELMSAELPGFTCRVGDLFRIPGETPATPPTP